MAYVNHAGREICCKIVYYGPGLSGKTTNVEQIHERTAAGSKGRLISLKTESERTLFFDFLPLEIGSINGFRARLQLYTVPGQVFYQATRRLILKGLDGVVFVADSQRARLDANLESLADLRDNLAERGSCIERIPFVIQYNKRDLGDVMDVGELSRILNTARAPEFEAAAASGRGVFETLKAAARMVLHELKRASG
jgi:signal recognition particle receptor subunit beta